MIFRAQLFDTKSDRWYVILDSIETDNPVDGLLPLVWAWREDRQEAESSNEVAKLFNSRRETKAIGDAVTARAAEKGPL